MIGWHFVSYHLIGYKYIVETPLQSFLSGEFPKKSYCGELCKGRFVDFSAQIGKLSTQVSIFLVLEASFIFFNYIDFWFEIILLTEAELLII